MNKPLCECLAHKLFSKCVELPWLHRRGNHELNREISATRQRGRSQGNHADAWDFRQWPDRFNQQLLSRLFPLAPRFGYHASEAAARGSDLKDTVALGESAIDVINLGREQVGLVNRGVRGALDNSEDNSLVLSRRQFALREHVERHDQRDNDRPENEDHWAVLQCPGERP